MILIGLALRSGEAIAEPDEMLPVTVRIHDYAGIPAACITSAQEHVTNVYAAIGVQTIWAETQKPDKSAVPAPKYASGELIINIVTPEMSRRLGVAQRALGLAAVTLVSGGKIAYLLFDRIREFALTSGGQPADILGLVLAHEIGHLLLPYGSHSPAGLMRPVWRADDFIVAPQPRSTFTPAQADNIRELLRVSANRPSGRSRTAEH